MTNSLYIWGEIYERSKLVLLHKTRIRKWIYNAIIIIIDLEEDLILEWEAVYKTSRVSKGYKYMPAK